jgi:hypothetical protein
MKVLIVETLLPILRNKITGWTVEDIDKYVPDKPIGLTPPADYSHAKVFTPFQALAEGWKLLGPPTEFKSVESFTVYEWWFTKE